MKKRILYIAQELSPFLSGTEISEKVKMTNFIKIRQLTPINPNKNPSKRLRIR